MEFDLKNFIQDESIPSEHRINTLHARGKILGARLRRTIEEANQLHQALGENRDAIRRLQQILQQIDVFEPTEEVHEP